MIYYDLETTGVDVMTARIIELFAFNSDSGKVLHLFLNPGILFQEKHRIYMDILMRKLKITQHLILWQVIYGISFMMRKELPPSRYVVIIIKITMILFCLWSSEDPV